MRASPNVESSPPEPLPSAAATQGGGSVRPGGAAWTGIVMSVLAWGFVLSLFFLSRERLWGMGRGGRITADLYLAAATLAAMAIGLAYLTVRGVIRRNAGTVRPRGDSQWSIAGRHFKKNRLAMAGLAVMILLYVVTLVTPLVAPFDPAAQGDIVLTRNLPPSLEHLMGTDKFGRDIFSRVLYGSRISLTIGFIAVGISVTLGTLVGALAGYFGGFVDTLLMRMTDMMLSFPRLVLLIVVIALFSPSIWLVVTVLGLTGWMGTARLVRGEVLSLREREFVQAARALGMGDWRIISRHVIPNTMAPVIVSATLGIGQTILTEASLSFLGLGVQPPTPSWGNMVADGRDALIEAWWIATFPGIAIVLTVIAFNLLGDGLRDALDPRLRT
ncbi:MAG TPA: oligopeptide ABC transporter permease [Longimicrobium sp.]